MNTKRIFTWGAFVVVIGLLIWGMIAAANKAERESASIASPDVVTATDQTKGATSSPLTLIEYSDFQCPACAAYYPVVERLLRESEGKVLFVYRHFPLTQHANAIPTAIAAEAADKQGKFWDMYNIIFTNQKDWEASKEIKTVLTGYATELSLDVTKFLADYESEEIREKVNNDLKSGLKAGVNSTPTFYLNGVKINPTNYEDFKRIIDQAFTAANNS